MSLITQEKYKGYIIQVLTDLNGTYYAQFYYAGFSDSFKGNETIGCETSEQALELAQFIIDELTHDYY